MLCNSLMPALLDLHKRLREAGGRYLRMHLTFAACHTPATGLVPLVVFGTLHEGRQVSTLIKLTV